LIKEFKKARTAAIGDGGNDVSMIQGKLKDFVNLMISGGCWNWYRRKRRKTSIFGG
jgi:hypothetical protein